MDCSAEQNAQELEPAIGYLLLNKRFMLPYVLQYSSESQDDQRFKPVACYPAAAAASWVVNMWFLCVVTDDVVRYNSTYYQNATQFKPIAGRYSLGMDSSAKQNAQQLKLAVGYRLLTEHFILLNVLG